MIFDSKRHERLTRAIAPHVGGDITDEGYRLALASGWARHALFYPGNDTEGEVNTVANTRAVIFKTLKGHRK